MDLGLGLIELNEWDRLFDVLTELGRFVMQTIAPRYRSGAMSLINWLGILHAPDREQWIMCTTGGDGHWTRRIHCFVATALQTGRELAGKS